MKANIKLILAVVAFTCTATALAQSLNGSYFMEGSLYRHELNPAFEGKQNYFSVPILPGNMNISLKGNLGVSDVFFNRNGKTVTYLHPDVSAADALSGINAKNKFLTDIRYDILSVGFKSWGGFNTITIGTRAFAGAHLPYSLFDVTKNLNNRNYFIEEAGVLSQAYAEIALGHSRQIMENLRVGAKVKFLIGIGRVKADLEDLSLNIQDLNTWTATAHAKVEANVKGLEIQNKLEDYKYENPDGSTRYYTTIDDVSVKNGGVGGFGGALDLGAEYDFKDLVPGLKVSLAVLDLGFIRWKESRLVENNGKDFVFNGFHNIKLKDGDGEKMSEQTDRLVDNLTDLYRLEDKGDQGGKAHMIGTTLNVGVEYALPMYDKLRFGLLSTSRFQGDYSWNEERLSVNYAPLKWLELNINGALGTLGPSFGWMINVHPVGFNLFLGMDHMPFKYSKEFIPLNSNADFCMGINFPLSKNK